MKVEVRHVEHLDKNRYRNQGDRGHASRLICAICTKRGVARSGKCAKQWYRAGPGKRWWNEQCGRRSERGRQRCPGSRAAAAAHQRPGDSEVQVIAKADSNFAPPYRRSMANPIPVGFGHGTTARGAPLIRVQFYYGFHFLLLL